MTRIRSPARGLFGGIEHFPGVGGDAVVSVGRSWRRCEVEEDLHLGFRMGNAGGCA
jgi:hypothetical protein